MLREVHEGGNGNDGFVAERPRRDDGMWCPNDPPHALLRHQAKPEPCQGTCRGMSFGKGEGCNYCDYIPAP